MQMQEREGKTQMLPFCTACLLYETGCLCVLAGFVQTAELEQTIKRAEGRAGF